MKKTYFKPEMDIYEIKMRAPLLIGSKDVDIIEDPITPPSEAEAPGLIFSIME